jgi:glutamyl-tRNA synthetase
MIGFLFRDEIEVNPAELIQPKMDPQSTAQALQSAHSTLAGLADFSHEVQEKTLRELAEQLGLKPNQLFGTLRVAVTGQRVSPPLFETMEILGRDTVLHRIRTAIDLLGA